MRLSDVAGKRVDGRPVAIARMLLAFAFGVCVLEVSAVLFGIIETGLRYPVLDVIPGPSEAAIRVFLILGLSASVFLLLGVLTGSAAGIGSALLGVALLWDQQIYSNHLVLVALLLAYLAFADSGKRWGLWSRKLKGTRTVPWWPQLLMLTQVSVLYFFAGISKINPRFLSGEPLHEWMWAELPLWMFQLLAIATIATEIFLAFGLWIPRVRGIAVIAGLGLHIGILVGLTDQTLVLAAFAAASVSTYWLFLTRPSVRSPVVVEPAAA